jgi:hypothetical protein
MAPLYSMKPSFRKRFIKKLTRTRVVPTISSSLQARSPANSTKEKLQDKTQHPGEHEKHENCPKHQPSPGCPRQQWRSSDSCWSYDILQWQKLCTIALRRCFPALANIIAFAHPMGLLQRIRSHLSVVALDSFLNPCDGPLRNYRREGFIMNSTRIPSIFASHLRW